MQVKKQQLELEWNNKLIQIGKGVCQGYIVTLLLEHHTKYQAGKRTRWNQDCQEKYQ